MVQSISRQVSANELAAAGIKLSLKEQLIDFIKQKVETSQQTTDMQNLLTVLEKS